MLRLLLASDKYMPNNMPNNILKWCKTYTDFKNVDPKTWQRIFKLPFQVISETRIQTFQYKIFT